MIIAFSQIELRVFDYMMIVVSVVIDEDGQWKEKGVVEWLNK
jgi:hypothetical protein